MKKKKIISVRFLSIVSTLVLITLICFTLIGGLYENSPIWLNKLTIILSNQYVSGVAIAITTVFIILDIQITLAKKGIKKDYRCQEILSDNFYVISVFEKILSQNPLPIKKENEKDDDYDARCNKYYRDFCIENKVDIWLLYTALTYENNNILFDTLKISMFFNLNFELISIINNILNRVPNFKKDSKAKQFFENKEKDITESDARHFINDISFLIKYWKDLFDYLKYDDIYIQVLSEYYHKLFPSDKFEGINRMNMNMYMCIKTFGKKIDSEAKRRRKDNKKQKK